MAEILSSYSTAIMVDVILDSHHRFANRDFYDASDRYYRGTLVDFPAISEELSDLYYGVEQASFVTLRFANEGNLGADRGPYIFESLQDFHVDYTETDPNARIAVAPNETITFAGLTENEDAWVYRDMGAGYFSGNFKIHFEVEITASTASTEQGTLILANSVKSYHNIDTDNESYLGVVLYRDGGVNYRIDLDECDSGARTVDSYTCATGTRYYCVMERKEEVGAFGTIYCYIYSDVDHINLLDTLSITLSTSKKDFRYIFGLNAHNDGAGANNMSGIVSNMYMYRERTWDGLANVQELREKWVNIQRAEDGPVDVGFLLAENDDFLTTEDGRYFLLSEFEEELKFQFRGKIVDYKLGDEVSITIEMRDDWILDTLLPLEVVTTDLFTATAMDLGEAVNICFGKCRNVPLRNIQNNTGADEYDYLIGYGTIQSLWIDHANGIGVKRDGVLVDTSEYTFYDGSQGTYSGYAFIRFTREQMNFSGGFHKLTADVYGLEMGSLAMQRNFANVVGNLLGDTAWGLSDAINAVSFSAAATALAGIGNMYCDGAVTEQRQARDILDELLFPARASIERNSDGEWEMGVDVAGASVVSLGDHDGYYDNAEIGDLSITPSNEALKTAIVQYSLNPLDEDMPFKESSVSVHIFGVERTYSLPFVLEDDTAELVLSYLKNRSLYSDRRVTVFAGMEGRDLARGDVVTLTKPTRLLSADDFKIERIVRGGIGFELECREYSADIYNDEVVVPPTGPTPSEITVEGPRTWVGDIQLGDGLNKSGTMTLNLAPGQGDCYIKGGVVDTTAWTCQGGFILGIDDSDNDIAKFYLGDSGGHSLSWNGLVLAITGTLTATAGAIGGWTINATSIYTGTEDHAGYTTNAGDITIYSDGVNASIHAKNFYIDAAGNITATNVTLAGSITATSGNIGGFYIGANDIWGGNAAIGNAATTIVLGNLDGTSKIALGASADAITFAGAQAGFIVDGVGNLRLGDATNSLKWTVGTSTLAIIGTITAAAGNIGGFYIGANDIWGGNAVIGNAATTIVLGNLDGTSKIALGASADAITIAGVQSGFIVDGGGNMRVGDTNSFLKWSGGALSIQLASGEAMTLSAGGDIVLTPSDTNSSELQWSTAYYLGAAATLTRGLCIWPGTFGEGRFRVGYDPYNNTNKSMEVFTVDTKRDIYLYATFDANNRAHYKLTSAAADGFHTWVSEEGGNTQTIYFHADDGYFGPAGAGLVDLGTDTGYWGDINYKTLDDRGCLGWVDDGVELQDGTIVSDLEALKSIKKHTTKMTVTGMPMLDYRTLPKPVYRQAGLKQKEAGGDFYQRDENDEPYTFDKDGNKLMAADGAEISSLISIMLGAIKELDKKKADN